MVDVTRWSSLVVAPASARTVRVYAGDDIAAECYPIHVAWFSIGSGDCLDSIIVYGPGPIDAPAPATWGEPVRVVLTFANGDREGYPQ